MVWSLANGRARRSSLAAPFVACRDTARSIDELKIWFRRAKKRFQSCFEPPPALDGSPSMPRSGLGRDTPDQFPSRFFELREAHREDLAHRDAAIAVLLDEHELLRVWQAGGNHHFAARLQLLEQWRRDEVGSRGHQHFVEGGVLGPAVIAVAYPELDIGAALPLQSLLRLLGELFDHLDAVDLGGQLREHRGVIAQAGADLEHGVTGADVEQVGHQRDNERLRDRLVEADRKRN